MLDIQRWRKSWRGLGIEAASDELFFDLRARYEQDQRKYHIWRHLEECFALLADAEHLAQRISEVELALWFHDAVYEARRSDNEEQSARWAEAAALEAGVASDAAERIRQLILATKHDAEPDSADAALLVDIDLAILGSAPARFDEYEADVRVEYAWVPDDVFRERRREILAGFIARPYLYRTSQFRDRFEATARDNLARSIAALSSRP